MIYFRNPGTIDIRAIKTFGLSSKDGQSKIGRFGTGLKYASAVIVRNGGKMTIDSDGQTYIIASRADEFRGQEIENLTMNGDDLPFTASLGRDWEPWMAFRELYSNALDEGGDVERSDARIEAGEGETLIGVDLNAFEAIFFSMEEHFIGRDETPIYAGPDMEVYKGRSAFVFYRGIAVQKLAEPAAFRYNLLGQLDLTEDRTAKYDFIVKSKIASALSRCTDENICRGATDSRNSYEASLDFSTAKPSDVFLGAAITMGATCNPTAMAAVRAQLPSDTTEATVASKASPGGECLLEALALLRALKADLSKCVFVLAEGMNFYGDYDAQDERVFLNQAIFNNQERMNMAVILGYAAVVGDNWMAAKLIGFAKHGVQS